MNREMRQVKVYAHEGEVCISQGEDGPHDDTVSVVYLKPEQIDILIDWLKEAKTEATGAAPSNR